MASCVKRFDVQEGRAFGFLDADTDSLGCDVTLDERYHNPNGKGSVTYRYSLREKLL